MRRLLTVVTLALIVASGCSSGGDSSFGRFTADDGLHAFQKAGVEVGDTRPMTIEDYGIVPHTATSGIRFFIPSLGADKGGRILAFASKSDLDGTKKVYDDAGRGSAAFFSWTFVKGNVLVQINGDLPEAQARTYEAALATLGT